MLKLMGTMSKELKENMKMTSHQIENANKNYFLKQLHI